MLRTFFCLLFAFMTFYDAHAQTVTTSQVAEASPVTLWQAQVARETALQNATTIEARDQMLPEFLQTLQKNSGVEMQLSPQSALATRRVTVRTEMMPLHELMSALARLYGAVWQRNGKIYSLQESSLSELESQLARVGDRVGDKDAGSDPARYMTGTKRRELAEQIVTSVGQEAFKGERTVSLLQLPEALRDLLRQQIQLQAASEIIEPQAAALPFLIENYHLYAIVPSAKFGINAPPQINLSAADARGNWVANVAAIPLEELKPGT